MSASSTADRRIAFVQASWHQDIVEQSYVGFVAEIARAGVTEDQIDVFRTPGAYEIPLLAKRLAKTGRYAAIVAAALVVDGGIYRHEFVAAAVVDGLMRVQLDTDVPVFSVVLTPHHFHEHADHHDYFHAHLVVKGQQAAEAVLGQWAALEQIAGSA